MRAFVHELLDAVYPNRCPLCSNAAVGLGCESHRLPDVGHGPCAPRCRRCDAALAAALPHRALCARCRTRGGLPFTRVAFDYGEPRVREWILALKHRARPDLAEPLAVRLAERFDELAEPERPNPPATGTLFVPVPVHPLRRFERGYDQAALLARGLARRVGGRFCPALGRTRWTPPQGAPGARSRAANVRAAFGVRARFVEALRGATVWLIDDVVVSGASVRACCEALRTAEPGAVRVLALARASPRPGPRFGPGPAAEP